MPRTLHGWWTFAYFAGWVVAGTGLAGVASWLLAAALHPLGIDDDLALLALPLGALLAVLAARRIRHRRALHAAVAIAGAVLFLLGGIAALILLAQSRALSGTGFLAGLGEVIAAFMGLWIAVSGAAGMLAGFSGRVLCRTPPPGHPPPQLP